jgi:hypothetical protein
MWIIALVSPHLESHFACTSNSIQRSNHLQKLNTGLCCRGGMFASAVAFSPREKLASTEEVPFTCICSAISILLYGVIIVVNKAGTDAVKRGVLGWNRGFLIRYGSRPSCPSSLTLIQVMRA